MLIKQQNCFDKWQCSKQPQHLSNISVQTSRTWDVSLNTTLGLVENFRESCVIQILALHSERNSSQDLLNKFQLRQKVLRSN